MALLTFACQSFNGQTFNSDTWGGAGVAPVPVPTPTPAAGISSLSRMPRGGGEILGGWADTSRVFRDKEQERRTQEVEKWMQEVEAVEDELLLVTAAIDAYY